MDEKRKVRISKFLSLILRHNPKAVGLSLDENGWARVDELLAACAARGRAFTRGELETVVAENDKKRFAFDEAGAKIRARQGHSLKVALDLEEKEPPPVLYHGTSERNARAILEKGLLKMRRHHVHLSPDTETAQKVGERRGGRTAIFSIDAARMREAGFKFYISENGVWLADEVPPEFLKLL
jgi:putative RNA 2'-phosphotransferase